MGTLGWCALRDAASARVPYWGGHQREGVMIIKSPPERAIAIYSRMPSGAERHVYQFEIGPEQLGSEGRVHVHAALMVPRCAPHRDFYPALLLVGPTQEGLTRPEDAPDVALPVAIPNGYAFLRQTLIFPEDRDETTVYETMVGAYYWQEPAIDFDVTRVGVYRLYAFDPGRIGGDYVLEFGERERWRARDWFRASMILPVLRAHWELGDHGCRQEVGRRAGLGFGLK